MPFGNHNTERIECPIGLPTENSITGQCRMHEPLMRFTQQHGTV